MNDITAVVVAIISKDNSSRVLIRNEVLLPIEINACYKENGLQHSRLCLTLMMNRLIII